MEDEGILEMVKRVSRDSARPFMEKAHNDVNFAVKRNGDGSLEYSVNGLNPERVLKGFAALESAVKGLKK
jgi:hypothetical protein